jgi:hypothetical protein
METPFRIAFLCDILLVIIELPMVAIFHELLKDVSPALSFAAVYLRILMLVAAFVSALFHLSSLFVALKYHDELALGNWKRGPSLPQCRFSPSAHCIALGMLMIGSRGFSTLLGVGQLVSALGFFVNGLLPLLFGRNWQNHSWFL